MIFYLNGAEHTAASKAATPFVFAKDDHRFVFMGNAPHPDNLPAGFGRQLNMALKSTIINHAVPYASNERIIRTTKAYLEPKSEQEIFVMILWAPFDRTEWHIDDRYYQVSTTLDPDIPKALNKTYKKFKTGYNEMVAQKTWHHNIWNFHKELDERGIKHLFAMESTPFTELKRKHKWGDNFINPYTDETTFVGICGADINANGDGFFNAKGHTGFMRYVIPSCVKILT